VRSRNNEEFLVPRLLFEDDTLIFCEASPTDNLHHMWCLFLCFEVVLKLKINLAKSKLVPIGAMEDFGGLASILGCRVSSLPVKYLGLLLGASFKEKSI
jgi:hypothetical protein